MRLYFVIRNLIGALAAHPLPDIVAWQEPWDFQWGITPRWKSSDGFHYEWIGFTVRWWSRRWDFRWPDNN